MANDMMALTRACMIAATLEREFAAQAFQRSDLTKYQQHSANASILTSLAKALDIVQKERHLALQPQEKLPASGKVSDPMEQSANEVAREQRYQGEPDAVPIRKGMKAHRRTDYPKRRGPATVPVDQPASCPWDDPDDAA